MRNIIIIVIFVFSFGIVSCGTIEKDDNSDLKTELLYEKYKNMVTEGEGCAACIDCAALALAITYETEDEILDSKQKLFEYYKENGVIPCPELLPELKQEMALAMEQE